MPCLSRSHLLINLQHTLKQTILCSSIYLPQNNNSEDSAIPEMLLSPLESQNLNSAIVAGDLNSRSPLWNSDHTCARGELIEKFLFLNNMETLNGPSAIPTFQSPKASSFIDAAFASSWLAQNLTSWETLDIDLLGSDHRGLMFSIQLSGPRPKKSSDVTPHGYEELTRNPSESTSRKLSHPFSQK